MQQPGHSRARGTALVVLSICLALGLLAALAALVAGPSQIVSDILRRTEASPEPEPTRQEARAPIELNTPAPRTEEEVDLRSNPFVQIAKDVGPSVVGISNKIRWFGEDGVMSDVEQGSGSGVILSEDGYIITNQHVVAGAESVSVMLSDGVEVQAEVVGEDAFTDVAVLKIEREGLHPVAIGDSEAVEVGEFVLAIGSPLGNELLGSVTMGIVSATHRTLTVGERQVELVQTDAAINPGNSGGALIDIHGNLIGINTVKYFYAGAGVSTEGLGFAIPINDALPVVRELIENGRIERPVLGVALNMLSPYYNRENGLPWDLAGARLTEVYEGSPAERAGLRVGDVLTHIDGEEILVFETLMVGLSTRAFGDEVKMTVYRDEVVMEVSVTLTPFVYPEE